MEVLGLTTNNVRLEQFLFCGASRRPEDEVGSGLAVAGAARSISAGSAAGMRRFSVSRGVRSTLSVVFMIDSRNFRTSLRV